VDVRRSWLILPRNRRAGWRIAYDTSFAAAMLRNTRSLGHQDVVICVSPPVQGAVVGAMLRKRWRSPLILLVKDLPLQAALAVGMMRPGLLYGLGSHLERLSFRLADRIVVINIQFGKSLAKQGVSAAKIVEIPDWAELEDIQPFAPESSVREMLGAADGSFLVLHAGNMGEKQGLVTALQAAQHVSGDMPIKLALVGDGAQRPQLEEVVLTNQLSNVRILPLQPRAMLPRLLAAADAFLLIQRSEVVESVVPSKMLAYMAAGRPVIAAVHKDSVAAAIVEQSNCGIVVPPENPRALADAMNLLRRDPEMGKQLGAFGRAFAEERFRKDAVLRQWDNLIADIVGAPVSKTAAMQTWN
jgi:colanic acid biosynthesis glycosyl transferase WcaI